ncbi:MAG: SDR family oxidoreductase [Chloroflexi bacterium]|nr:SDR family oxidoreductase [Chloroflexota bacterium]
MKPKLLEHKVAFVTGAGRGIGRAAALALAQAGAAVVLAARSADEINSLADEIKHHGGKALAIPTDVSDVAQVDYLLVLTIEGASAYNASKAALERFSGTLAAELTGSGVVVTTLRPGQADTSMQAEIRRTPAYLFPKVADWEAVYQQGKLRSPTEPAQAILWLASDFAQDCNGQLFDMNDPAFQQRLTSDLGR